MKRIGLLLLLLPCFAKAQQDFDYKIFTHHMAIMPDSSGDTAKVLELSGMKYVIKENRKLTIVDCLNTGQSEEYIIQYVGFSYRIQPHTLKEEILAYTYITEDQKYVINIWPTTPMVEIRRNGTNYTYQLLY